MVLGLEQRGGRPGRVFEARGDGPRHAPDLVAAAARAGKVRVDVGGGRGVGLVEGEVLRADLLHSLIFVLLWLRWMMGRRGGEEEREREREKERKSELNKARSFFLLSPKPRREAACR